MYTYLTMLAATSEGPSTTKLQNWAEDNIIPVIVLVLVIGGLIASLGGKTAKIIAIIACVILVGVLYSGGALEIGKSLGELITP